MKINRVYMYCSNCGKKVKKDTQNFCTYCGAKLSKPENNVIDEKNIKMQEQQTGNIEKSQEPLKEASISNNCPTIEESSNEGTIVSENHTEQEEETTYRNSTLQRWAKEEQEKRVIGERVKEILYKNKFIIIIIISLILLGVLIVFAYPKINLITKY